MYEFELNFGDTRIRMRKQEDPNETKHQWDSVSHNHAGYELHVLLQGSAKVDVDGREYLLPEHHAMIIGPGQYHCPTTVTQAIDRFSFSFTVSNGPLLEALHKAVPVCCVYAANKEILSVCRDVFHEFSAGNAFSHIMLQSHLMRLLVENFRLLQLDYAPAETAEACPSVKLAHRIDVFFEDHLTEGAYVEALARELHLSRSQLNRFLKDQYGMTFREKLLRTRLDRASWLLRHTEKPVEDIVGAVGYSSESAFFQVFRKHFGMTPEKYRKQHSAGAL